MSTTEDFTVTFTISGTFLCEVGGTDPDAKADEILQSLRERAQSWMDDVKAERTGPIEISTAVADNDPRLQMVVSFEKEGFAGILEEVNALVEQAQGIGHVRKAQLVNLPPTIEL